MGLMRPNPRKKIIRIDNSEFWYSSYYFGLHADKERIIVRFLRVCVAYVYRIESRRDLEAEKEFRQIKTVLLG